MRAGGIDIRCDGCGSPLRVRFDTNGMGGTVELVEPCRKCAAKTAGTTQPQRSRKSKPKGPVPYPTETEEEARRRWEGICRWCDKPVDGALRRSGFCAEHRRIHKLLKRIRRRHPLKVKTQPGATLRHGHCEECQEEFEYQKCGKLPSICPKCNDELEAFAKRVGYNLRRK